jgi:hypothetical protein
LIAVVDGRPSSPTFNQALPAMDFTDYVQSFAIDDSAGLMYVTVVNYGDENTDLQSRVSVVDVNPGSGTFHQVLRELFLSAGAWARGVAVNPVTHKAYVAVSGADPGVYVLQGSALTVIPDTQGSWSPRQRSREPGLCPREKRA